MALLFRDFEGSALEQSVFVLFFGSVNEELGWYRVLVWPWFIPEFVDKI